MNDRKGDRIEKPENRGKGDLGLIGIVVLGIVCCVAGPTAVLVGLASLGAWFSGLGPYVGISLAILAGISLITWIARKGT